MRQWNGSSKITRLAVAAGLGLGLVFASAPAIADDHRGGLQTHPDYGLGIGNAVASIFLQDQSRRQVLKHSRKPDRDHFRQGRFQRQFVLPHQGHFKGRGHNHFRFRGHGQGRFQERFVMRGHGRRDGHGLQLRQRFGRHGILR